MCSKEDRRFKSKRVQHDYIYHIGYVTIKEYVKFIV